MLGDLFVETLLGNLFPRTLLGNLATVQANLFLEPLLGNLRRCSCEPCLEPVLVAWEPGLNLAWKLFPGTLPGTLAWEPILGNLQLGNLFLVTLLANLFLENLNWKSCSWEPGWEDLVTLREPVGEKLFLKQVSKEEAPKQVSRKRFPSKANVNVHLRNRLQVRFPKTTFPSKVPGTVSAQGSKQEQGLQEQVPKQAFPGRAGSQAKFPRATGNPCVRTSSWEPCLRTSS